MMTKQREPLQTSALTALGKAAIAYQSSPQLQASYSSRTQYFSEKVGHLFRNGSHSSIWHSRLHRARQIVRGKPIPKSKSGRQAFPTSTWEALSKAAVAYQNSPDLQTSYPSKAQYYNEKVGHLFRNGNEKGCLTWERRLYHARRVLRHKNATHAQLDNCKGLNPVQNKTRKRRITVKTATRNNR